MKHNVNTLVARGLGWFSIGLGAMEIIAPGQLSKLIAVAEKSLLMSNGPGCLVCPETDSEECDGIQDYYRESFSRRRLSLLRGT